MIMAMNSRDIIRLIEIAGWVHVETRGSHWQFTHPSRPGRVTVPHPKRDLPIGTLRSIEKQAGVILRRLP
jgi:predicted RNA binding protein YcfA (HicA-like mRNA interferase family)